MITPTQQARVSAVIDAMKVLIERAEANNGFVNEFRPEYAISNILNFNHGIRRKHKEANEPAWYFCDWFLAGKPTNHYFGQNEELVSLLKIIEGYTYKQDTPKDWWHAGT